MAKDKTPSDKISAQPAVAVGLEGRFTAEQRVGALRAAVERQRETPVLTEERAESVRALKPDAKRFHGAKVALAYFPQSQVNSPCADKYGYMSTAAVRTNTRLPFDVPTRKMLRSLGQLMMQPGPAVDSTIPAGYTYFGQFVDHDVTLDVSSTLDAATDATTINNMRSPSLDLDSVYGRGPALDAFLYAFPASGSSAIKFQLGSNRPSGPGGPSTTAQQAAGMKIQQTFDVPRVINPLNPALSTNTAIIGDPRNDENLIVAQFHHAMLKFHNQVVDDLVTFGFNGDIFAEAKRLVTHHYQWAVVHDYLEKQICGPAAVTAAMALNVPIGSAFSMPVEFAVAAYRFGHSMIRHQYWVNFAQPNASLKQVFDFIRNPLIPVLSNWVVDFNAFFPTGVSVPVNNKALKIDSALAAGLASLPGLTQLMAELASRNLLRGLAMGLPSGQGMAQAFGLPAMTNAQLLQGLPAAEAAFLNANPVLLTRTPLWYYCLREAAVLSGGNKLGPVGARIVAETFVRMLKRDPTSYLNANPPFQPSLVVNFTVADLIKFSGVNQPV
jgi:hypothetical protein